jgi:plastocyanin
MFTAGSCHGGTSRRLCYAARVVIMSRRSLPFAACLLAGTACAVAGAAATGDGPASPAAARRLEGRIELVRHGRPARGRDVDLSQAVVWYEPDAREAPPRTVAASMTTVHKQFDPQLLVVPVGSTVTFPNGDPILHNVFSVSGRNSFDLGLVGAGKGKSATFREPGLVRVFCNVHHRMFAHVMVVDTSHYAMPDAAGRFVLEGLPAGSGTLRFWQERGDVGEQRLALPAADAVVLRVEMTRPRLPDHTRKDGRSYGGGVDYE